MRAKELSCIKRLELNVLSLLLLVFGNIVFTQLFHFIPLGGKVWLPIYLFVLVSSYLYGVKVGLIISFSTVLFNSFIGGIPSLLILYPIVIKLTLLSMIAGMQLFSSQRNVTYNVILMVLFYQIIGSIIVWAISGNLYFSMQDFYLGIPGLLLQIVAGTFIIKKIS